MGTDNLHPQIQTCLSKINDKLKYAHSFEDLKKILDIRGDNLDAYENASHAVIIELVKRGDPSATMMLNMMDKAYSMAATPDGYKKDYKNFDELKKYFTESFGHAGDMISQYQDAVTENEKLNHGGPSQQPNLARGGLAGSAMKALQVTLKQIDQEGRALSNLERSKNMKGMLSPLTVAAFGKKAVEKFQDGDIAGGVESTAQGLLVAATQMGAFKTPLKAMFGLESETMHCMKIEKTLKVLGRDMPVVGIIFSETGTIIGVVQRIASGDLAGATGEFVAGTLGNIVAEVVEVPAASLMLSELTEELAAQGINRLSNSKTAVRGSSLLSAANSVFGNCKMGSGKNFNDISLDANGKVIVAENERYEKNQAPINTLSVKNSYAPKEVVNINEKELKYIESVEKVLAAHHDPIMSEIVDKLKAAFSKSADKDLLLADGELDKQLKARGINTKTWTIT